MTDLNGEDIRIASLQHRCIVGVFDLLGQTSRLINGELSLPPSTPDEAGEVAKYVQETAGLAFELRRVLGAGTKSLASASLPESVRELLASDLKCWGAGDSCFLGVMARGQTVESVISDTFNMIRLAASAWRLFAANGTFIRGGIEIGTGVEFENREIYGSATAAAVWLEHNVAEYPRIVVGPRMKTALDGATKNSDSVLAVVAGMALQHLTEDEDGVTIINVAAESNHTIVAEAEKELGHHRKDQNRKLVKRYSWLLRRLRQAPTPSA